MKLRIFLAVAGAAACLLTVRTASYFRDRPAEPSADAGLAGEIGRVARLRSGAGDLEGDVTGALQESKTAGDAADAAARRVAQADPSRGGRRITLDQPTGPPSERAVLERLGERREEIEGRAREIDTREQLLRAAEKKLDGRVSDLKTLEEKLQAGVESREHNQTQGVRNLVVMYETMKPKDAARIFDRLDVKVLMPVVQKINPRKMAEILAAMSPETAERLTVALAARPEEAAPDPAANELPRIEAPAPRAPR